VRPQTEALMWETCGGPPLADPPPPSPADVFTDDGVLERDLDRVFRRAWLPLVHTSELPEVGAWVTASVGRWRLVVVQSEAGPRAFHNVCRHRAALVADGPCGRSSRLVCRYHGFTYGLDGGLLGMREADSFGASFSRAEHGLKPVTTAVRYGYVWARISDDGPDLDAFLGAELTDHLANWPLDDLVVHHSEDHELAASWRVGNEGFLETLHLPSIHRQTINQLVSVRGGSTVLLGDHSLMYSPFRLPDLYEPTGALGRIAAAAGVLPYDGLNRFQQRHGLVYHLFPTTTLNLLPNHVTIAQFWPIDRRRCRVRMQILGTPARTPEQAAWFDSLLPGHAKLLSEDDAILASVQEGLETGAVDALPLSRWEARVAHFRRRLEAWHA
jgi:phenylpropionate dioxygenase-like ring-hydroxylating dioxygenase large terminal subunit